MVFSDSKAWNRGQTLHVNSSQDRIHCRQNVELSKSAQQLKRKNCQYDPELCGTVMSESNESSGLKTGAPFVSISRPETQLADVNEAKVNSWFSFNETKLSRNKSPTARVKTRRDSLYSKRPFPWRRSTIFVGVSEDALSIKTVPNVSECLETIPDSTNKQDTMDSVEERKSVSQRHQSTADHDVSHERDVYFHPETDKVQQLRPNTSPAMVTNLARSRRPLRKKNEYWSERCKDPDLDGLLSIQSVHLTKPINERSWKLTTDRRTPFSLEVLTSKKTEHVCPPRIDDLRPNSSVCITADGKVLQMHVRVMDANDRSQSPESERGIQTVCAQNWENRRGDYPYQWEHSSLNQSRRPLYKASLKHTGTIAYKPAHNSWLSQKYNNPIHGFSARHGRPVSYNPRNAEDGHEIKVSKETVVEDVTSVDSCCKSKYSSTSRDWVQSQADPYLKSDRTGTPKRRGIATVASLSRSRFSGSTGSESDDSSVSNPENLTSVSVHSVTGQSPPTPISDDERVQEDIFWEDSDESVRNCRNQSGKGAMTVVQTCRNRSGKDAMTVVKNSSTTQTTGHSYENAQETRPKDTMAEGATLVSDHVNGQSETHFEYVITHKKEDSKIAQETRREIEENETTQECNKGIGENGYRTCSSLDNKDSHSADIDDITNMAHVDNLNISEDRLETTVTDSDYLKINFDYLKYTDVSAEAECLKSSSSEKNSLFGSISAADMSVDANEVAATSASGEQTCKMKQAWHIQAGPGILDKHPSSNVADMQISPVTDEEDTIGPIIKVNDVSLARKKNVIRDSNSCHIIKPTRSCPLKLSRRTSEHELSHLKESREYKLSSTVGKVDVHSTEKPILSQSTSNATLTSKRDLEGRIPPLTDCKRKIHSYHTFTAKRLPARERRHLVLPVCKLSAADIGPTALAQKKRHNNYGSLQGRKRAKVSRLVSYRNLNANWRQPKGKKVKAKKKTRPSKCLPAEDTPVTPAAAVHSTADLSWPVAKQYSNPLDFQRKRLPAYVGNQLLTNSNRDARFSSLLILTKKSEKVKKGKTKKERKKKKKKTKNVVHKATQSQDNIQAAVKLWFRDWPEGQDCSANQKKEEPASADINDNKFSGQGPGKKEGKRSAKTKGLREDAPETGDFLVFGQTKLACPNQSRAIGAYDPPSKLGEPNALLTKKSRQTIRPSPSTTPANTSPKSRPRSASSLHKTNILEAPDDSSRTVDPSARTFSLYHSNTSPPCLDFFLASMTDNISSEVTVPGIDGKDFGIEELNRLWQLIREYGSANVKQSEKAGGKGLDWKSLHSQQRMINCIKWVISKQDQVIRDIDLAVEMLGQEIAKEPDLEWPLAKCWTEMDCPETDGSQEIVLDWTFPDQGMIFNPCMAKSQNNLDWPIARIMPPLNISKKDASQNKNEFSHLDKLSSKANLLPRPPLSPKPPRTVPFYFKKVGHVEKSQEAAGKLQISNLYPRQEMFENHDVTLSYLTANFKTGQTKPTDSHTGGSNEFQPQVPNKTLKPRRFSHRNKGNTSCSKKPEQTLHPIQEVSEEHVHHDEKKDLPSSELVTSRAAGQSELSECATDTLRIQKTEQAEGLTVSIPTSSQNNIQLQDPEGLAGQVMALTLSTLSASKTNLQRSLGREETLRQKVAYQSKEDSFEEYERAYKLNIYMPFDVGILKNRELTDEGNLPVNDSKCSRTSVVEFPARQELHGDYTYGRTSRCPTKTPSEDLQIDWSQLYTHENELTKSKEKISIGSSYNVGQCEVDITNIDAVKKQGQIEEAAEELSCPDGSRLSSQSQFNTKGNQAKNCKASKSAPQLCGQIILAGQEQEQMLNKPCDSKVDPLTSCPDSFASDNANRKCPFPAESVDNFVINERLTSFIDETQKSLSCQMCRGQGCEIHIQKSNTSQPLAKKSISCQADNQRAFKPCWQMSGQLKANATGSSSHESEQTTIKSVQTHISRKATKKMTTNDSRKRNKYHPLKEARKREIATCTPIPIIFNPLAKYGNRRGHFRANRTKLFCNETFDTDNAQDIHCRRPRKDALYATLFSHYPRQMLLSPRCKKSHPVRRKWEEVSPGTVGCKILCAALSSYSGRLSDQDISDSSSDLSSQCPVTRSVKHLTFLRSLLASDEVD